MRLETQAGPNKGRRHGPQEEHEATNKGIGGADEK